MSTDNNSLKTRLEEHRTGGHTVQLLLEKRGSQEVCIDARGVNPSSQIEKNSSTTSTQLWSPTSDLPHGTNTSDVYTFQRLDGLSYAVPVTISKQPKNEKLESPSVGLKHDQNKPPLAYIPKAALYAEGEAFAFGAKKYEAFNYRHGIAVTRTLSAAIRHILQFIDGEDK